MIYINGGKVKVVRMADGLHFKMKPEYTGIMGRVVNRNQLASAVRKYYLEGK